MKKGSPQRIEALTDGVFAIVMTLLVLELSIPLISEPAVDAALSHRLLEMWPKYLSYVVSFLVLGLWWLFHHGVYENMKRIDARLLWFNLFFLMFVSLVPFSASLVAQYWDEKTSALIYGTNMILCYVLLTATANYATKKHLVEQKLDPVYARGEQRAQIRVFILIILAVMASFFNSMISLLLWGLMSAFYIVVTLLGREGLQARKSTGGQA